MNWKELFTVKDLNLVTGIENTLRGRRRAGLVVLVMTVLVQVTLSVGKSDYLQNVAGFLGRLITGPHEHLIDGIKIPDVVGLAVLILGITIFTLGRWSRLLLRETGEPFRYTFWIDAFRPVPADNASARKVADFDLLQYDLRERLNFRIRRLSLLNDSADHLSESQQSGLIAHIHIGGEYSVCEHRDSDGKIKEIAIRIMTRVRIGPPELPETLTSPVELILPPSQGINADASDLLLHLDSVTYDQVVERTYSRIAQEIYQRIKSDLGDKVTLFPTAYLRAVALFHEAKDFERSNTIDAYDYALDLYRAANRYFDTRLLGPLLRGCARIPLLWWLVRDSLMMEALTKIGYARCLIYRRAISALSGRYQNPLYVIPETIEKVILRLNLVYKRIVDPSLRIKELPTGEPGSSEVEQVLRLNRFNHLLAFLTFRGDAPTRRLEKLHERLCETLFEAYSVGALGYAYLGASQRARIYLENARAIAPRICDQNALWLLAAAECEFDIDNKLHWIEHAAEQDPESEIALYRRAFLTEMRLRSRNELQRERVLSVIQFYERVLKINPANIGALAATGYLYWLIENPTSARQKYKEGLEVKSIVSQTFVGDLSYGLARVDAEEGHYEEAYRLFSQALSADPAVGTFSKVTYTQQVSAFFEYIGDEMLARFDKYLVNVVGADSPDSPSSADIISPTEVEAVTKTRQAVRSFVLNDCGNAYLNAFFRIGDDHHLARAVRCYERAIRIQPEYGAAYFNIDHAYTWWWEWDNRITDCLDTAQKLAPDWPAVVTASVRSRLRDAQSALDWAKYWVDDVEKRLRENREELFKTESELGSVETQSRQVIPQTEKRPEFKALKSAPGFQTPDPELPGRLKMKIERLNEDIKYLESQLKDDQKYMEDNRGKPKEAVDGGLERIATDTKLSYLFAYKKPSEVVDVLISSSVRWERLDLNDVEALITLAEFLSLSPGEEIQLQDGERIAHYILRHDPENYQAYLSLDRVFTHRIQAREKGLEKASKQKEHSDTAQEPVAGGSTTEVTIPSRDETIVVLTRIRDQYRAELERILHSRITSNLNRCAVINDVVDLLDKEEEVSRFLMEQADYSEHKDEYSHLLGRSYAKRYALDKAVEYYMAAVQSAPAQASHHAGLGIVYLQQRKWSQAIRSFRTAVSLAANREDYKEKLARCYHEAGMEYLEKKLIERAIESIQLAIESDQRNAEYHASLSVALEAVAPKKRVTALTRAAASMKKACDLAPRNEEFQERMRRLQQALDLSPLYGEEILDMKPEVDPIVIEVGKGLEKLVWSGEGEDYLSDAKDDIWVSQSRIRNTVGLDPPPILLRRSQELPQRGYCFLLRGIPIESGDVPEGKRLIIDTVESLERIGVQGENVDEKAWWIGRCCWFDEENLMKIEQAGLKFEEPLLPMWNHFRFQFLDFNMVNFISYESIRKFLEENKETAVYRIAESPDMVRALVNVFRMLAQERVPITDLSAVCDCFAESYEEDVDPISTLDRIRLIPVIRKKLPGNEETTSLLQLSEEFEKLVETCIYREGARSVLAMEPEPCQEALTAIREEVNKGPEDIMALLVRNAGIRHFVRRLVELEFPYLWVLSRPEVQGDEDDVVVEKRIIKDRFIRLPTEEPLV